MATAGLKLIAVVGPGSSSSQTDLMAEQAGAAIARAGLGLVCGGLGGAMEAACRGAKVEGGTTVGILPGQRTSDANPYVDIAVATGLSEARNAVVVTTAAGVVAVGGSFGTLSEIALAMKLGRPVVGVGSWRLERDPAGGEVEIEEFEAADDAVRRLLEKIL